MANDTINMRIKILNVRGLHARAAAKFVELVDTFDVSLLVKKDNLEASGDSIMGLLMLAASRGTEIELVASGLEAAEMLSALSDLINNLFGEEM